MTRQPFRILFPVLCMVLAGLFHPILSGPAARAAQPETPATQPASPAQTPAPLIADITLFASDATLNAMGDEIRAIYVGSRKDYSTTQNTNALNMLLRRATAVATKTDALLTQIKPYESVYQSFVDILGKPEASEPASITEQRKMLTARQQDISGRITRLRLYQLEAQQLMQELRQHGTAIQQATMTQRFPTPLGVNFWSQLSSTAKQDRDRAASLVSEIGVVLKNAFTGQHALLTLGALALSGLLLALHFFCHTPVRMLVSRFLPTGRIRPITAAVICSLIGVVAWGGAFQIIWNAISFNNDAVADDLSALADMVAAQVPLCGFVLELGMSILSRRPEWRVFPMPDTLARNLRLFPFWFASALIVRGVLRYVDTQSGLGLLPIQLLDGLYTLAVSPLLFAIPRQLRLSAQQDNPETNSAEIAPLLRTLVTTIAIVCWGAVLTGYIPLGYTIISWVSVMAITMTGLLLVALLATALGSSVFPSRAPVGAHLVRLGLPARLVDQASVVIPGLISVFLLVVAFSVATAGADFDPSQVGRRILSIFKGQAATEGSFNLSLDAVLLCAGLPILGHYAIRIVRNWFRLHFFPTTRLDIGAQASILNILTYSAWIVIGLCMTSALGVTVKSMTWVVSALSVGIGFGLQSIVQNFVSGIILMAERPVSIGDVVDIAGAHGEVARISVRSTNIKLADGSTMIVPNSQFITSAVRNATRAEKPGVFTIPLQVPFTSDLHKAMNVMTSTLAGCENVEDQPVPTASITSVTDGSAVLTGTARARVGMDTATVRSEALFALWQAFQDNQIPVTVPSTLIQPAK
ncbi:mechanosensitive ion channel domain-containing protein [Acetobacter cerevisiae]|uniref:Mechanosensitive ion channel protein MscS n=1 Tax=Acetobacter cerevisiae TaxID=178900 RepID=A0A149QRL1_9PROT|nr:mechanosensitive ion channel domain-containing protein [Acetobacter cerevisiae]KXU99967.1 mechanosensitive ion channel protein MscS [Acetobacter cerevisiae]